MQNAGIDSSLYQSKTIRGKSVKEAIASVRSSVLLFVASAYDGDRHMGIYRVMMVYGIHHVLLEGEVPDATSFHECALHGIFEAVMRLRGGCEVVLVSNTQYGFRSALQGKGCNRKHILCILNALRTKGCTLSELHITGRKASIIDYIAIYYPQEVKTFRLFQPVSDFTERVVRLTGEAYLQRATQLLNKYGIAREVIEEMQSLCVSPEEIVSAAREPTPLI